jgi:hypothetical protein
MEELLSKNKIDEIKSLNEDGNPTLSDEGGIFKVPYYTEEITDSKMYKKIIRNIRSQIRTSQLYKDYIQYLHSEVKLDTCAILGNVTDQKAEIEIHHYPFTLFDIIDIVLAHKLENGEKFSTMEVSQQILKDHYDNIIGIVPLAETVHELAHAGEIFIPLNMVFGDIQTFVDKYRDGMANENINKLNSLIDLTKQGAEIDPKGLLDMKEKSWDIENVNNF